MANISYARLVISFDAQLFDGINNAINIGAIAVALPSDKEVQEQMITRSQAPPTATEEDNVPGEFF